MPAATRGSIVIPSAHCFCCAGWQIGCIRRRAPSAFQSTSVSADDLYRNIASWLAVAVLLEAILGVSVSRRALLMAVGRHAGAAGCLLWEECSLPLEPELAGGIAAVLVWILVLSRVRLRAAVVAVLFTASLVAQALEPFTFSAAARPFGWIPFRSFLESSFENGVPVFFEKSFTYGGFIWLGIRAGIPAGSHGCLWRRIGTVSSPDPGVSPRDGPPR